MTRAPLPIPLRTPRLLLRHGRPDDGDRLAEYLGDPEVCRFLKHMPLDLDDCRAAVRHWDFEGTFARRWLRFVVEMGGVHVGYLTLDRFGERLDIAEVGWVLHPEAHGRGIASEAARALLGLAFGVMDLHRIEARVDPRNDRSIAVCRRLGMQREGCLRQVHRVGDERRDELVFGILKEEWASQCA